jgi:hypothetical protein
MHITSNSHKDHTIVLSTIWILFFCPCEVLWSHTGVTEVLILLGCWLMSLDEWFAKFWRRYNPSKCREILTQRHTVTSRMTGAFSYLLTSCYKKIFWCARENLKLHFGNGVNAEVGQISHWKKYIWALLSLFFLTESSPIQYGCLLLRISCFAILPIRLRLVSPFWSVLSSMIRVKLSNRVKVAIIGESSILTLSPDSYIKYQICRTLLDPWYKLGHNWPPEFLLASPTPSRGNDPTAPVNLTNQYLYCAITTSLDPPPSYECSISHPT